MMIVVLVKGVIIEIAPKEMAAVVAMVKHHTVWPWCDQNVLINGGCKKYSRKRILGTYSHYPKVCILNETA